MSEKHLENVSFDFIRYANCWEDADVLLKGLQLNKDSKVMSIASAGDNCFALLSQKPAKVVALDVSLVQLFLVELKKVAISHFNRAEFLAFIGFEESNKRKHLYTLIREELSSECMAYWDDHLDHIEKGLIHQGKFEAYFQLFKNEVLPKVHNQQIVADLFAAKTETEQLLFHDQHWHTEAWEVMYRQFFGVEMMGTHGRDPEFLKHVKGSVPDLILKREMEHLRTVSAQTNYFLYYILNNEFHPNFLPFYVRTENYENVQANLDQLVLHHGLLDTGLNEHPDCTHFNLSDIFEYMDKDLFRSVGADLIKRSADNARFGYWNLLIPRYLSQEFPNDLNHESKLSAQLKEQDLGYFYGDLVFETKK